MDGLKLWKNNIDKRFEGVDECMICFYVLHGTNFQLPRITCRTCKKKFHSACLVSIRAFPLERYKEILKQNILL